MLRAKLLAVVAVGLSAAACSYNSTTTSAVPSGPGPVYVGSGAGQACVEYGFPRSVCVAKAEFKFANPLPTETKPGRQFHCLTSRCQSSFKIVGGLVRIRNC